MMESKIEVITYEQDRLNFFTYLMNKAQKRYRRLFKKYKDAPILSDEYQQLSDAGREAHFFGDVVEMLEKGNRKQSEGTWIEASNKPYSVCGKKCSLCGARIRYSEYIHGTHKYCHNCGAKMKGGE